MDNKEQLLFFSPVIVVAVVGLLVLSQLPVSPMGELIRKSAKETVRPTIHGIGVTPPKTITPRTEIGRPIDLKIPIEDEIPKVPSTGDIGKLMKNKFRSAPQLGASFGKQKREDERKKAEEERKRKEAEEYDKSDLDEEEEEREKYDTPDIDEEEKSTTPKKKAKRCLCAGELISKISCTGFGTPFADVCDPLKLDEEDLGFCMSTPPCMKYCKKILKEKLLDPCVKKASAMGARCYIEGMRIQARAECK